MGQPGQIAGIFQGIIKAIEGNIFVIMRFQVTR